MCCSPGGYCIAGVAGEEIDSFILIVIWIFFIIIILIEIVQYITLTYRTVKESGSNWVSEPQEQ